MLFGFSFVSYMERVNISVAAELMMPSLSLSRGEIAAIFNSFLIGYAIFQVPAGWLGDRFGARRVLGISAILWGVITVLSGFMPGALSRTVGVTLATLWVLRFLLGTTEATTYPVAARAVHLWISSSRRGFGSSLMLMGSSVASAITAPLVSWTMLRYGWRVAFYLTSTFAFVIALLWLRFAPTPPTVEQPATAAPPRTERWLNTNVVLLSISYISEGYLLFTFVSWLYMYLVEVRGFSLIQGGMVTSLPWVAAIIATPLGGLVSDYLTVRFGRIAAARILIMTGYSCSGLLLLAAAQAHSRSIAVLGLCISLGSLYLAESSFWTTANLIAGDHAGVAGGFMNTIGLLGGVASNALVPLLVERYGWIAAFGSGTFMGLFCALVWWFLGKRLALPNTV